jgi:putative sterol carrier protein
MECAADIESKRLSSEFQLHSHIYRNSPARAVIHCHLPLSNGYFSVYSDLKVLTFETRLYLGSVPVVEQETPTVTKPELVIEALKTNNLVVVKHHGVVSVGENFDEALYLIETLEEAVKVAGIARLFKKEVLDDLDRELKGELTKEDGIYPMFSREHIQAIVDLVNQDEFIGEKGRELNLTVKLAIQLDGSDWVYKFTFEKGKITELSFDDDAPFVISAPRDIWELIFLGKLDPFVAVNQRKMKLKGDLLRLSCWYTPFSRLFELFKQVRIR